jgi:hypothetical protein
MTTDRPREAPLPQTTLSKLFALPEVSEPGVRWARPAHHLQRHRARGGLLYMTDEVLGFAPRGIDAFFGARAVTWELSSISDVALKPSLRKVRVTLETASGREHLIAANAAVVYQELQSLHKRQDERVPLPEDVPGTEGGASA